MLGRASAACFWSSFYKSRNLPLLKALEAHLVCWRVARHFVREMLSFHSCKQLKYPPFQNTSSWLMNKKSIHPSAAVGKKIEAKGKHKFWNGSPVRMVQKRNRTLELWTCQEKVMVVEKTGLFGRCFLVATMLGQEDIWFAQTCTTASLGLHSQSKMSNSLLAELKSSKGSLVTALGTNNWVL